MVMAADIRRRAHALENYECPNNRIFPESNIGGGKSTAIRQFGDSVVAFDEPMEKLGAFLAAQYTNSKFGALAMQLFMLKHYVEIVETAAQLSQNKTLVIARHPLSIKCVFGAAQLFRGHLSTAHYNVLAELCNVICRMDFYADRHRCATLKIYVTPEEAFRRKERRQQPGDSLITMEYLILLGELYEKYFAVLDHFFLFGSASQSQ